MDIRGFTKEGNWYKGNLHSHTTNSDGTLPPKEMAKLYRKQGYNFLCISDHDFYTDYRDEFDRDKFKILPGYEASGILFEDESLHRVLKVHHMNAILGTSEMQAKASVKHPEHRTKLDALHYIGEWDGAAVAQKMADDLNSMGFIATYNHPVWSRVRPDEFVHTDGIFAMEIFNYGTVNESGNGYDTYNWDSMLRAGKKVMCTATDDNHNKGKFDDVGGGYIVVKAKELTHDNIISNMIAGNYYSSSGPEIYSWGISDGTVYVECSKVNRINFIAGNFLSDGATVMRRSLMETLQGATYKLKGHESYVRVECVGKYGRTAWTNPIFLR